MVSGFIKYKLFPSILRVIPKKYVYLIMNFLDLFLKILFLCL